MSRSDLRNDAPAETRKTHAGDTNVEGYLIALLALAVLLGLEPLIWSGSSVSSEFSFIILVMGAAGLLRANLCAAMCIGFFAWALLGAAFSNVLIENGAYISEQFRVGTFIGSTNLLCVYSLAFLMVAHLSVVSAIRRSAGRGLLVDAARIAQTSKIVAMGLLFIASLLALVIVLYGTAADATRFEYWNSMPPAVRRVTQLARSLNGPAAAVGTFVVIVAPASKYRKLIIALMLVVQAALFLMGDKMSPFVSALMFALFGAGIAIVAKDMSPRVKIKHLFWMASAVAALVLLLVRGVMGTQGTAGSQTFQAIIQRAALQGHVWFGVLDRAHERPGALVSMGEVISRTTLDHPTGLNALSMLVAPPDFVMSRISRGITFTMGGPAVPLALFGPAVGALVFAGLGLLIGIQVRIIMWALRSGRLATAAAGAVFGSSIIAITMLGNWYSIYNIASIGFAGLVVASAFRPALHRR